MKNIHQFGSKTIAIALSMGLLTSAIHANADESNYPDYDTTTKELIIPIGSMNKEV